MVTIYMILSVVWIFLILERAVRLRDGVAKENVVERVLVLMTGEKGLIYGMMGLAIFFDWMLRVIGGIWGLAGYVFLFGWVFGGYIVLRIKGR